MIGPCFNHTLDEFEHWAYDTPWFANVGEPEYDDDGEVWVDDDGEEWVDWWTVGMARTKEAAEAIMRGSMDEGERGEVGTAEDGNDLRAFIDTLRGGDPAAIFDAYPDPDDPSVLRPKSDLPLVITAAGQALVIKMIEDNGGFAIVEVPAENAHEGNPADKTIDWDPERGVYIKVGA